MTNDEAVELATRMRAAGVQRFTLKGDTLTCVLLPPAPTPMDDIVDRVRDLPPDARQHLLDQAKKDLEADLYGAAR